MSKFWTLATLVFAAAMLADVLAHGQAAEQAATGVSTILTPSLQAASGQTITATKAA